MTATHRFRCGDEVSQEGLDYTLEIAYADYESGRASWCGWPDGSVEIEKLALVKACTDEEHKAAVALWLDREHGSDGDHRRSVVKRLYRPRAYWRDVVKLCEERFQDAQRALGAAGTALQQAEQGPEDA